MERIEEEYLKTLTEQIRYEKIRSFISKEFEDHLEDQAQCYEEDGMSHQEAIEKAVEQMGDPITVGVDLDRIHRPRTDWKMFLLVALCSITGLLVLCLVGRISRGEFVRQLSYMLLGAGLMIGIYQLDYSFLGKYPRRILCITAVLLGAACKLFIQTNGRCYQMVSPMYLFAPIYGAVIYGYRGQKTWGLCKVLLFMLLPAVVCNYGTSSLPTTFNLVLIFFIMVLIAVVKGWFHLGRIRTVIALCVVYLVTPVCLTIISYSFLLRDYQKARITAFLNPEVYATEAGYIYIRIRELLAGSHFFGVADGMVEILPAANEYLLIQLILNYGIVFGVLIVILLVLFLIRAFNVTCRQKNQLGMMVGMGCFLTFLLQLLEGIAMNFGFFPATALNVPFLSMGAGATFTNFILVGILLSIYRYQNLIFDRKKKS